MKYANSLKYMNGFESAGSRSEISARRIRELCEMLGRVNIGTKYVFIPGGTAGHASAIMLESVIKSAGYTVGRISSESDFDSRASVFVNGELPTIEDYNKSVAELKSIVIKNPETVYFKEEAVFALSLLITKLVGCEYVILEGLSDEVVSLDSVCAPYDLIVIPTLYCVEREGIDTHIICDAIRRGAREVVSGNQRASVYGHIMDACASGGIRLAFTAKGSFEVKEFTSRRLSFTYSDRDGYTLKSPSRLLRECAMLVIESALAIRRDGVKMPWSSIMTGLSMASDTGCFDILSVSPLILIDSASCREELKLAIETGNEIFGERDAKYICVCIPDTAVNLVSCFDLRMVSKLIILSESKDEIVNNPVKDITAVYSNVKDVAREAHESLSCCDTLICAGSLAFSAKMKNELLKLMNG